MRSARCLALLLLFVPLVAAQVPDLRVDEEAGGLTVSIQPSDEPLSAYVVVTYEDELSGEVLERIVPVEVSPEIGVEVTIDQMRPGVNVTVRLLERDVLDALLDGADSLLSGSLVEDMVNDLPVLDELDLGQLLPDPLPFDLYAYPYAPLPTSSKDKGINNPRVHMNQAGILAVSYVASDFDNGSIGEPVVRLSSDLGHRFGPVIQLAPGTRIDMSQGTNHAAFSGQVALDGAFLFIAGHDGYDGTTPSNAASHYLGAFTTTRVEPLTGATSTTHRTVPEEARFAGYIPLILPDGTVLAVSNAGPRVARFDAAGGPPSFADLETEPSMGQSNNVWAHAGARGDVAVVWTPSAADEPMLRAAVSRDGGRTWAAPINVTGIPQGPQGSRIASGAIDDLGALHLAVLVDQGGFLANEMRYVRVPGLGAPTVQELPWDGEAIQYTHSVALAAAGGRAWILGAVVHPSDITLHENGGSYRSHMLAWERLPEPIGVRDPHEFAIQQANFRFEGEPALMPDGRLVVLGSSQSGYGVVPTFDPFPEPGCASRDGTVSTPTPSPMASRTASTVCDERFSLQSIAGAVQVRSVPVDEATQADDPLSLPDGVPPEAVQVGAAAAVVLAVAGIASLEAVRYGAGLAAASLFSRVQGKQVLQHAIRGGIHDHIVANPGIRFKQIRKDLGLSHGATAYHLRVLERNGLVRARVDWTTRHYDPVNGVPAAVATPAHDVILDFMRSHPGAGPADVARNLGLSRQLAHYHLRRLARAGRLPAA